MDEVIRNQIKKKIVDYINRNEYASYRNVELIFDKLKFNWQGELEIPFADNKEIVSWYGWNEEAIELMKELESEGMIRRQETDLFKSFAYGKPLVYPNAVSPRKYNKENWKHVFFGPVKPMCNC